MSRLPGFFKTPLYRNTGSTARDHLANERTFLSWVRTGLGFVALGVAFERFGQLDIPRIIAELKTPAPSLPANSKHSPSSGGPLASTGTRPQPRDDQLLVGTLLGTGMGSLVYGATRYFSSLRLLEQGSFKPAFNGPAVLSCVVAGIAGASLWAFGEKGRGGMRDRER